MAEKPKPQPDPAPADQPIPPGGNEPGAVPPSEQRGKKEKE